MPRLSCRTCGRQIYTVSPIGSLFPEERRCPRCGAYLNADRREAQRRVSHRRVNPTNDPGPPKPKMEPTSPAKGTTDKPAKPPANPKVSASGADVVPDVLVAGERRVADRRTKRRRSGTT